MVGAKKAIVAGATGSVGRLIVQTCLKDSRIAQVTAVVRKPVDDDKAQELWGTSHSSKLKQVPVDFATLNMDDTKVLNAFEGNDAFLTGMGVYSSNSSEAEMTKVEVDSNKMLASLAHQGGAKRGAYLSGQGVKQPKDGRALAMFARVKGRAEEELAQIFDSHVSVRPGGIFDRPGPPVYGAVVEGLLHSWPLKNLKNTQFGISAHDIAKGMVQGALFDDDKVVAGNTVWENNTIREAARRYEQQQQEV